MRTLPSAQNRLQLLNNAQPGQPWASCAEKRQCIMCETVFRGNDVTVRQIDRARVQLACPSCGSAPQFWVRVGNPLLNDQVWQDWELAMTSYTEADGGDHELATAG
jgi:hypothetical protein